MSNKNKVLTISYGSFSCTLEGFDDPFEKMKEIAEYFRDMAAKDRHFGAVPAQQASLRDRIAEDAASRSAGASAQDGRIKVQARDGAGVSGLDKSFDGTSGRLSTDPNARIPHPAPDLAASQNSVVANRKRPWPSDIKMTLDETARLPVDAPEGAADFFARGIAMEGDGPATEGQISMSALTAYFDQHKSAAEPDSEEEDETASSARPAQRVFAHDSLVDKLDRLRSLASQQDETARGPEAYEEETVDDEAASGSSTRFIADMDQQDEGQNDDTLARAVRDISDAQQQDEDSGTEFGAADDESDDLDAILRHIHAVNTDRATHDAQDAAAENDGIYKTDEAGAYPNEASPSDQTTYQEISDEQETADPEIDADPTKNQDKANASAVCSEPKPALSLGADRWLPADVDAPRTIHKSATARASSDSLPDIDADAGEDVTRLMAQADQQMQEAEGQTRRSAFSHLRAAVAARFADTSIGGDTAQADQIADSYRSDLAEVVQRPPPLASPVRTIRPGAEPQTGLLRLVAEQRVDTQSREEHSPAASRHLAPAQDDDVVLIGDSGFAAYAEARSATSLLDLLEAAAAYLSNVEGHAQFSRPQLMAHVRQADCDTYSREDGLRAFGQLLRAGKIKKIRGGNFAASDSIGFKPV